MGEGLLRSHVESYHHRDRAARTILASMSTVLTTPWTLIPFAGKLPVIIRPNLHRRAFSVRPMTLPRAQALRFRGEIQKPCHVSVCGRGRWCSSWLGRGQFDHDSVAQTAVILQSANVPGRDRNPANSRNGQTIGEWASQLANRPSSPIGQNRDHTMATKLNRESANFQSDNPTRDTCRHDEALFLRKGRARRGRRGEIGKTVVYAHEVGQQSKGLRLQRRRGVS